MRTLFIQSSLFLAIVILFPSCIRSHPSQELSQQMRQEAASPSTSQEKIKADTQQQLPQMSQLLETAKNRGKLISAHILDFNGFSETITNKERLSHIDKKNFLHPQQYKKVLRIFKRNTHEGMETLTLITSYHENGQIHRYLECINGRACGNFREWYDNGQIKIEATIIAGAADLDEKSIDSWTFDGTSIARNPRGQILGIFNYKKGLLDGVSTTYSQSGSPEWITDYTEGKKTGFERRLRDDGTILEEISYTQGLRDGVSRGYWPSGQLKYQEDFHLDLLKEGVYYREDSPEAISQVINGEGIRSLFDDERLMSQCQIMNGKRQGLVRIYSEDGSIQREYGEIDGQKNGKDTLYYAQDSLFTSPSAERINPKPKLSIEWRNGAINGVVETWYPHGSIESRREMKQNERDGVSMSWYPDGTLMLVEEYEKGSLKKGRYLKRGEATPCSTVHNGKGIATLFDRDGHILERVEYAEGKPLVKD